MCVCVYLYNLYLKPLFSFCSYIAFEGVHTHQLYSRCHLGHPCKFQTFFWPQALQVRPMFSSWVLLQTEGKIMLGLIHKTIPNNILEILMLVLDFSLFFYRYFFLCDENGFLVCFNNLVLLFYACTTLSTQVMLRQTCTIWPPNPFNNYLVPTYPIKKIYVHINPICLGLASVWLHNLILNVE